MRRLLALVVALVLCAGCTPTTSEGGFVSGDGSLTTYPLQGRPLLPDLDGETLDGEELASADLRGEVTVINVWGSWCGPCRAEAPDLVDAAQQLGDRARFVGVNTRDASKEAAVAFTRSFGVDYPNWYDPNGALVADLSAVTATPIPTTIVVDAEGRVAAVKLGTVTAGTLVGIVEDLLQED